jgi:hypothetical protein
MGGREMIPLTRHGLGHRALKTFEQLAAAFVAVRPDQ